HAAGDRAPDAVGDAQLVFHRVVDDVVRQRDGHRSAVEVVGHAVVAGHHRDAALVIGDPQELHLHASTIAARTRPRIGFSHRVASHRDSVASSSIRGAARIAGLSVADIASVRPITAKAPIATREGAESSSIPATSGPSGAMTSPIERAADSTRAIRWSGVNASRNPCTTESVDGITSIVRRKLATRTGSLGQTTYATLPVQVQNSSSNTACDGRTRSTSGDSAEPISRHTPDAATSRPI